MSAQVKLRAWIARMPSGTEFSTTDVRNYLKSQGIDERQSGGLLTYMVNWWKIAERIRFGHYKRS